MNKPKCPKQAANKTALHTISMVQHDPNPNQRRPWETSRRAGVGAGYNQPAPGCKKKVARIPGFFYPIGQHPGGSRPRLPTMNSLSDAPPPGRWTCPVQVRRQLVGGRRAGARWGMGGSLDRDAAGAIGAGIRMPIKNSRNVGTLGARGIRAKARSLAAAERPAVRGHARSGSPPRKL